MDLMVVDDSKGMRQMISQICADIPHLNVVATARDGLEAIKYFKIYQPELITMDLTMPNMEGVEAITKIMEINPNVKILVVSALSDQETALESISAGAKGFIYKPFSKEELMEAILGILEP